MATFKNAVEYLPMKIFKLSTGKVSKSRISLRRTKIH